MAETTEVEVETTETTEVTTTEPEATAAEVEKWRTLSRKNEKAAKDAARELERLREASMSDQERAVAEAKAEGRREATSEVRMERVRDKIEAKAAGKLADPEDAAALLGDLTRFVADDGSIDTRSISIAIDDLVKSKPYLAPGPGNGSGEGGPRGVGTRSSTPDPLLDSIQRAVGGERR